MGDTPVTLGDENPACSPPLKLSARQLLPATCNATGRYLTIYVEGAGTASLILCEVYVYLAGARA